MTCSNMFFFRQKYVPAVFRQKKSSIYISIFLYFSAIHKIEVSINEGVSQ
jgi:hypothetical protein